MLKKPMFVTLLLTILLVFGCSANASDKSDQLATGEQCSEDDNELNRVLAVYMEFLRGTRNIKDDGQYITINDIFISEEQCGYNEYALFDMNGDGIPELHVKSPHGYNIYSYRDGDIVIWNRFSAWSRPLNNGAVMNERPDGANSPIIYTYSVFDFYGNIQLSIFFEKYNPNYDGVYDENSDYFFENIKVTKTDWDVLTKKYLSVGSDEIKWHIYQDGIDLFIP